MLLSASCPKCRREYQLDSTQSRTQVTCVACKATFQFDAALIATRRLPPVSSGTIRPAEPADEALRTVPDIIGPSVESPLGTLPRKLGRFELRQLLGSGSFGAVYLAYDTTLKREIALKIPHVVTLMMSGGTERFMREAQTSAQLRHPNIVPIFDAGEVQGQFYIASALIHGSTLDGEMKRRRFAAPDAAKLVAKLAEALAYAHRLGVIHRDVKPANIMLDAQGEPFLMDFGIARWDQADPSLSSDASSVGTPLYMSPEQAGLKGVAVGPGCDQYSLGVVLYELLCGRTPFLADTSVALLLRRIRDEEFPTPRALTPSIPRDLEAICVKSLGKRPEHRYCDANGVPSCRAMADDLRRHVEGEPIHARRVGPVERLYRWSRRNPVTAGLSISTLALLLAIAVFASISAARMAVLRNQETVARRSAEESSARETTARELADQRTQEAETLLALAERRKAESETAQRQEAEARARETEARILADKRAQEAVAALKLAEQRQAEADMARNKEATAVALAGTLQQQEAAAKQQAADAQTDLKNAQKRESEIAWSNYAEKIKAADDCWESNQTAQAWKFLNETNVGYRDWEFDYLTAKFNREQLTLVGHPAEILHVALSRDGRLLASADTQGNFMVWDVAAAQVSFKFLTPLTIGGVAISPLDGTIATGLSDRSVKLWDSKTGKLTLTLQGQLLPMNCVQFSPNGLLVAAGGSDRNVTVWNAKTGKIVDSLRGHTEYVTSVAFSPDGLRIVSGSNDKTVRVWSSAPRKDSLDLVGHTGGVTSVAVSPDGSLIAAGGVDGTICIWRLPNRDPIQILKGHEGVVTSVQFSSGGAVLISGGYDHALRVWDAKTGETLRTLRGHSDRVNCLAVSADGKRYISAGRDQTIKIWETGTSETIAVLANSSWGRGACFSPDGDTIVGCDSGGLTFWNASTCEKIRTLTDPAGTATAPVYCPKGDYIAYGAADHTLSVWNASTLKKVHALRGHADDITCVTFDPGGGVIATASKDGTVQLWNTFLGNRIKTLTGHMGQVNSVAFSPDGKWIVTAGADKTAKIWESATGLVKTTLDGHEENYIENFDGAVFSPDGRRLVIYHPVSITYWTWVNGTAFQPSVRLPIQGNSFLFHPKSKRFIREQGNSIIAVGCFDSNQDLLLIDGGSQFSILKAHAFSTDGRRLLVSCSDSKLRILDATSPSPRQ